MWQPYVEIIWWNVAFHRGQSLQIHLPGCLTRFVLLAIITSRANRFVAPFTVYLALSNTTSLVYINCKHQRTVIIIAVLGSKIKQTLRVHPSPRNRVYTACLLLYSCSEDLSSCVIFPRFVCRASATVPTDIALPLVILSRHTCGTVSSTESESWPNFPLRRSQLNLRKHTK
jgi:hypothetical protein